jgi:hypothetical protein
VTPILVRPVREQLEHDRVIRLLQARWRRKYLVTVNQGNEQTASVTSGESTCYPDLVLASLDRGHKTEILVEVETAESVNNLEAMAQWAHLGRARAPFHLYVPAGSVDIARRLAAENGVNVAEIWSFHTIGDQTRFTLVHKTPTAEPRRPVAAPAAKPVRASAPRSATAARAKGTVRKAVAPQRGKGTKAGKAAPRKVAARAQKGK